MTTSLVKRNSWRGVVISVATISAASPASATLSGDGNLDDTFDGDGKVTIDWGPNVAVAHTVAIQPNGKVVVAGSESTTFLVARLNSDGSLDETFGGDGQVAIDWGYPAEAYAVAILPNGKIVVAGGESAAGINADFLLAQLNGDGSLDATFGGDGMVTVDWGTNAAVAYAVAIQPNAKIVVAGGLLMTGATADFLVARLNRDGSLDQTFDGDGKVAVDWGYPAVAHSVAIHRTKIVVAGGESAAGINADFLVARLNSDGSLDATFDNDGLVTVDWGTTAAVAYSVAIQPNSRVVVSGGLLTTGPAADFLLARLRSDGSLDDTFDGDGKVAIDWGYPAVAYSVGVQPNGKVVVAGGESAPGINADFLVARLSSNGVPDGTFDGDGMVTIDWRTSAAIAYSAALQPNGKIVVAGGEFMTGISTGDFLVARLNGENAAAMLPQDPILAGERADLNGDGVVDVNDLVIVVLNWGAVDGHPCQGDANRDGVVGVDDVAAVILARAP